MFAQATGDGPLVAGWVASQHCDSLLLYVFVYGVTRLDKTDLPSWYYKKSSQIDCNYNGPKLFGVNKFQNLIWPFGLP